jgi:AraC-like DNA-binding protein
VTSGTPEEEAGTEAPVNDGQHFGELMTLLDLLTERVDALDQLAGEGVGAQENRTIRQSRAQLARTQSRQVRAEVSEIRHSAAELARRSRSVRDAVPQAASSPGGTDLDPVLMKAATAVAAAHDPPGTSSPGRMQRLLEQALLVAPSVRWAQLCVVRDGSFVTWSTGGLSTEVVRALEDGPRAAALAGAEVVEDVSGPGPAPVVTRAGLRSVLAQPLFRDPTSGALVLAAEDAGTFDAEIRTTARAVADHVAWAITGVGSEEDGRSAMARALLDGARAVLGRHLRLEPDQTLEALLEIARIAGEPVLASAERLIAALVPRALPEAPATSDPATLRRALTYLHRHAGEDIAIDDVAAAAALSLRGLQHLFRRHRHVTPTEYLRRVRLDRAHAELLGADPTAGTTVGGVAARWRFTNPGRFSTLYRARFGCSPSETLRS